jgi:hypothetical protein
MLQEPRGITRNSDLGGRRPPTEPQAGDIHEPNRYKTATVVRSRNGSLGTRSAAPNRRSNRKLHALCARVRVTALSIRVRLPAL